MKISILIILLALNPFLFNYTAFAQEESSENLEQEVGDDEFLADADDEDYDFGDEEVGNETADSEDPMIDDSTQQAQNDEMPEDETSNSGDDSEFGFSESEQETEAAEEEEKKERKRGELQFETADAYQEFSEDEYKWAIYLHYGFQFANTSEDFTSTVPLPNEYSDLGGEIQRHLDDKPYYFGARLQIMDEVVDSGVTEATYSMKLLTLLGGYKFIDGIVSVSGTLGLVVHLASTLSLDTSGTTTDPDYKIGTSYVIGIMSVVKFSTYHAGFDGGILTLSGQTLDGEDFDKNSGGYFRFVLGKAF